MKSKLMFPNRGAFLFRLTVALMVIAQSFALPVSARQAKAVQKDATPGQVSAEAIRRHVTFLAADKLQGRRAGTPEADEAAKYIAAEFRRNGLKPLSAAGFLQPFTFVSGVKLGTQNSFRITTLQHRRNPPT